jgi:hypothetical protein
MPQMVKIQALQNNGHWYQMAVVANNPSAIKRELERAANSAAAKNTRKARAVDEKTGALIDVYQA